MLGRFRRRPFTPDTQIPDSRDFANGLRSIPVRSQPINVDPGHEYAVTCGRERTIVSLLAGLAALIGGFMFYSNIAGFLKHFTRLAPGH